MPTPGLADGTSHNSLIEAPISFRAYLIGTFASFGGILFGYDSGYINGVLSMNYVKRTMGHSVSTSIDPSGHVIPTWKKSLIVSILSAGTFCGALLGGDLAERLGRRLAIMLFCLIFAIGVAVQIAADSSGLLVGGRIIAGLGVGGVSTVVILYVSEIAPRRVRGVLISVYQWAISIGLLLASCIDQGTHKINDPRSYRVPIGVQFIWAGILAMGLALLPESPRFLVKKGKSDEAIASLGRIRGQPADSDYIIAEFAEIQVNYEYELKIAQTSWLDCFRGGWKPSGNLRRVAVGVLLQMFQQWTGINFIFYYGTTFFQQVSIHNAFLVSVIINFVNVASTPLSFYAIERFGRRSLLIWGAAVMIICEFIVAIVGTADGSSRVANRVLITFVVIGELFPLPIRAKGVALSTASNWLWNCIIAVVTPYIVDRDKGNLGAKVFFIWGFTCILSLIFAYIFIPETKGLSLEQIDCMLEETSPRTSVRWQPHSTYAHELDLIEENEGIGNNMSTIPTENGATKESTQTDEAA